MFCSPTARLISVLLAVSLLGAACTGSGEPDFGSEDAESGSSSEAGSSQPEAAGGDVSEENATAEDEAPSNRPEPDITDDSPNTGPAEDFSPLVRFENGELDTGEPIDVALIEAKAAEASLAAFNNSRTCATQGYRLGGCNFEQNVSPFFSSVERLNEFDDWFQAGEGQKLVRGEQDLVVLAKVEVFDATPPIDVEVHLCIVDSGISLIEADGGREEEILDDEVFAYVLGHLVENNADGVLTVAAEFNVVPITEDLSLCDEFL